MEKALGLMGANLGQQFLGAGLVGEIRIHLVDVPLGGGGRLFDQVPQRFDLRSKELSQTGSVTHLEYRVVR
jgi:dihydrofolate reductase